MLATVVSTDKAPTDNKIEKIQCEQDVCENALGDDQARVER
jgi:hypothetical protein